MADSAVYMLGKTASKLWAILLLPLLVSFYSCTEIIRAGTSGHEHVSTTSPCENDKACSICRNGGDKRMAETSPVEGMPNTEKKNEMAGTVKGGKKEKNGPEKLTAAPPVNCPKMTPCVAMPVSSKECGKCPDSRIDQAFRWTIGWINSAYGVTIGPALKLGGQVFTCVGSLLGENPLGCALKSIGSFLSSEPHEPRICFVQALRFSAETMGYLKPKFLDLGQLTELTLVRIWSWVQTLAGPFLFVMFSLALKNKLKR